MNRARKLASKNLTVVGGSVITTWLLVCVHDALYPETTLPKTQGSTTVETGWRALKKVHRSPEVEYLLKVIVQKPARMGKRVASVGAGPSEGVAEVMLSVGVERVSSEGVDVALDEPGVLSGRLPVVVLGEPALAPTVTVLAPPAALLLLFLLTATPRPAPNPATRAITTAARMTKKTRLRTPHIVLIGCKEYAMPPNAGFEGFPAS